MILQQQKNIWQQRRYVVCVKETCGRDEDKVCENLIQIQNCYV